MKIQPAALVALVSTLLLAGVLQAQITGVTAGTDLTGGGTSGNVTLNLDTTKVPRLAAARICCGARRALVVQTRRPARNH